MWPSGGQRWPTYGIGIIPRHVRRLVAPSAQDLRDAAVAQYQRERAAKNFPSPLAGEGQGGGSEFAAREFHDRTTPTPNPSPQGGGEQAAPAELSKPLPAQRTIVRSVPPRALVPGAPRDQDDLRLSIMRKLMQILKPWRGCPARVCRRHRDCASPYLECQFLPARQVSPERGDAALTHLQRALARRRAGGGKVGATPALR